VFSDGSSPPRRPGSDGPDGQAVFQKLAKPTTSASKKRNSEIMKLEEKF
tara:strand:- start:337 stop:483 length:147 start_codon:yes stop_codon:yes gene_type:complete